jgi:hypothetical protein
VGAVSKSRSSHDFVTTRARLDEQIPLLDPLVSLDLVMRHASWAEVESTVAAYFGPTGFVALARLDQGALLSLNGEPLGATRYLVGNPLLARRVLKADPAAALYAPFGVAVLPTMSAAPTSPMTVLRVSLLHWDRKRSTRLVRILTTRSARPWCQHAPLDHDLGLGDSARRIRQLSPNGPIAIATVHDPDGVLILLTPGSISQANS